MPRPHFALPHAPYGYNNYQPNTAKKYFKNVEEQVIRVQSKVCSNL